MPERPPDLIDRALDPAAAPLAASAAPVCVEGVYASGHPATGGRVAAFVGVWGMVATIVVASVVVRVVLRVADLPASAGAHVVPVGIALAGAFAAVQWVRRGARRQLADGVSAKVAELGGGIYGAVALATLLYLEALDLAGDAAAAGSLGGFLGQLSFGWLMAQMMESVGFFVTAITWPWYWLAELGPGVAGLVAGGVWALHGVLPRLAGWWRRRRGGVAVSEEMP